MKTRKLNTPGLRPQALLISFSLLLLVVLLGTRAYSVARMHFDELSDLSNRDIKAQTLLAQMENSATARDQAQRKFRITHDSEYLALAAHHEENIQDLSSRLDGTFSRLGPTLRPPGTLQEIHDIRTQLEQGREEKITHAHEAALGLLRLILLALLLSGGVTAWLLTLFYRGLLEPLKKLKEATSRIRNGELSFRVRANRGVTELRDLSASFNLMAERLEQLDNTKTEFLATISHELKNPLAALKEGMNLLATQGEQLLPHARSRAFSACVIAAKRLESMINNLLNQSRLENGLYDFNLTPKDLTTVIHTAIEEVRPLAQRKRMTIEYRGDAEILAAFNWDGMLQVLENLLLNAIKYGNEDSVIDVHASMKRRPHEKAELPHLELAVINEGRPISETDLSQVFDRFFRGSNSSQQQGMGLGLHVVRRIVEAHHGGIRAASEEGKTRFALWIPGRYETEAG